MNLHHNCLPVTDPNKLIKCYFQLYCLAERRLKMGKHSGTFVLDGIKASISLPHRVFACLPPEPEQIRAIRQSQ